MESHILAPGLSESELMKSLALYGCPCFNLHIYNAVGLAKEALLRDGISVKTHVVNSEEELALIMKASQGISYFGTVSYADAQKIVSAVRTMRQMVGMGDEAEKIKRCLEQGEFEKKNQALWAVYENYIELLAQKDWMDPVGLVRKAILECNAWETPIGVLDGFPLTPLEQALADKLSNGQVSILTFHGLYQKERSKVKIKDIKMCYGMANEVETILQDIYESDAIDRCTIAVTEYREYSQLIYDYQRMYEIPVTFGRGIPITNTLACVLLRQYVHWITDGFFGAAALLDMLKHLSFNFNVMMDRFMEPEEDVNMHILFDVLGNIRFTNDYTMNQKRLADFRQSLQLESYLYTDGDNDSEAYKQLQEKILTLPYLEIMAEELALPVEEFIAKYTWSDEPDEEGNMSYYWQVNQEAVRVIQEKFRSVRQANPEQSISDVASNLYREMVGVQSPVPGAVHVTDITGAMSCLRPKIFVAGLAASKYPKYQQENFLLLDEDIAQFGAEASGMLSTEKTNQKRSNLLRLVSMASTLGSDVNLSYAGMDVSELKKDNASSMIFELCQEEKGSSITNEELNARIVKVGYFEPRITATRLVGQAYNADNIIQYVGEEENPSSEKVYTVDEWVQKKKDVQVMEAPERTSAFTVISDEELEQLLEKVIGRCAGKTYTDEQYRSIASEEFDRFMIEHPPINEMDVKNVRAEWLKMIESTYCSVKLPDVFVPKVMNMTLADGKQISGRPHLLKKKDDGYGFIVYEVCRWKEKEVNYNRETFAEQKKKSMKGQFEIAAGEKLAVYKELLEKNGYPVKYGIVRNLRLNDRMKV